MSSRCLALALALLGTVSLHAAPQVSLTRVAGGLTSPLSYVPLPDGRALIVDQPGFIRLLEKPGQLRESPVLTLTPRLSPLNHGAFDERGVLTAKYTNGQDRSTGQLAIASFRNPQGLQSVGGNAWKETQAVGSKVMDVPGTGNLGDIVAGAVEESNVDLTAELVNLITAQRTYQANAQSIKTQDQVTQTFLNMR
jgi:hypothetical protein